MQTLERPGVVSVRDMTWYRQWRHTCFANVGQCFQWGATKVLLAGIKGELANKYTMQEFPSLLEDLSDAFTKQMPPLHKGEYKAVEERRIDISCVASLMAEATGDTFVVFASVPNQYFDEMQRTAGTNRNVILSYGEAQDCASGMPRDAPKAQGSFSSGYASITSEELSIIVVSATWSWGNTAQFFINGKKLNSATNTRGLNCVQFDPHDLMSVTCVAFDTYNKKPGIDFQKWITEVPDGHVVMVAAKDSAQYYPDDVVDATLAQLGGKLKLKFRGPYALIAVKGSELLAEVAGDDNKETGMMAAVGKVNLRELREAIKAT